MKMLRKAVLGLALISSVPISATPAEARDHHRYYSRHYDNDAAVALSAGIVGLAIGAAIASDRPKYYYYDDDDDYYYYRERYYRPHYRSYNYYYYDSYPRYYDRRWYRYNDRHWRHRHHHHHHDHDDDD